jgi:hypothetical protein
VEVVGDRQNIKPRRLRLNGLVEERLGLELLGA